MSIHNKPNMENNKRTVAALAAAAAYLTPAELNELGDKLAELMVTKLSVVSVHMLAKGMATQCNEMLADLITNPAEMIDDLAGQMHKATFYNKGFVIYHYAETFVIFVDMDGRPVDQFPRTWSMQKFDANETTTAWKLYETNETGQPTGQPEIVRHSTGNENPLKIALAIINERKEKENGETV